MITPETVKRLAASTDEHCLTLYLNTGPGLPRNAYVTRFHTLLRELNSRVPVQARREYEAAVDRVSRWLEQLQPRGNSCLVYAGERSLEDFSSRVPVRDEVHWGRPDVSQLLWLLEEYRPYGLLIADREHVRFLAVRLGEFECCEEFAADIDTADWRRRVIGSAGRGPAVQKGGVDSRAFENRYAEQIRRFWRSLHRPLTELIERYHVRRLVVAANKSRLPEFAASLPTDLAAAVVVRMTLDASTSFTSPSEAVQRIYPAIEAWEEDHDRRLVHTLLDAASFGNRAAVGIVPVLKYLQDGRAARLVVAKTLDRSVFECGDCGYVTSEQVDCPVCSKSSFRKTNLTFALARLTAQAKVPFDIVKRAPAEELIRNSGLGAFLRY
ncbi:MAG: VLRF1 family aeRF1-type release factor [candidate division WOR-3 bacterium]